MPAAATTAAAMKSATSSSAKAPAARHAGKSVVALDARLPAVMDPAEHAVIGAWILALESRRAEAFSAASGSGRSTSFGSARKST